MYNSRIETFNNLLYLDIHSYNYAILFDSNLDLTYDRTMFKFNGSINDHGIKNIFENLKHFYIVNNEIQENNINVYPNNCMTQTVATQTDVVGTSDIEPKLTQSLIIQSNDTPQHSDFFRK